MTNPSDGWRKAAARVQRNITTATTSPGRMATWLRKDYPRSAPARGHNYLIALCGLDYSASR